MGLRVTLAALCFMLLASYGIFSPVNIIAFYQCLALGLQTSWLYISSVFVSVGQYIITMAFSPTRTTNLTVSPTSTLSAFGPSCGQAPRVITDINLPIFTSLPYGLREVMSLGSLYAACLRACMSLLHTDSISPGLVRPGSTEIEVFTSLPPVLAFLLVSFLPDILNTFKGNARTCEREQIEASSDTGSELAPPVALPTVIRYVRVVKPIQHVWIFEIIHRYQNRDLCTGFVFVSDNGNSLSAALPSLPTLPPSAIGFIADGSVRLQLRQAPLPPIEYYRSRYFRSAIVTDSPNVLITRIIMPTPEFNGRLRLPINCRLQHQHISDFGAWCTHHKAPGLYRVGYVTWLGAPPLPGYVPSEGHMLLDLDLYI
ncbi:hypothetical protein SISSUDRAFT_1034326 [Sistotremastrum suecicum HHB10207 ss-3]|uniref:Uncharacterized protein n=1 Tax=Sistotremastrum suecicum HHB10207 ss-3 TaxID=1314776 RepID=A0A166C6R5_9AGAM|nr:hypothetical protein SISSUDRAFT_1034326 [Sistotremastrum suecicum HHB10207 ss-3]